MAATKTVSLNRIISTTMHSPRTTNGYVLYPKVDGYSGQLEGDMTKAEQDPLYQLNSKTYYNSATNIRKLWITQSGVRVQYYGLPKYGNKKSMHTRIKKHSENLKSIAEEILKFSSKQSKYLMNKSIGIDGEAPIKYRVTGNCLGVLSSPYACNNIEEVYLDWSIFLSEEVAPYFPSMCNLKAIEAFYKKATTFREEQSSRLIEMLTAFALGGVKDIRSRFPRLRLVAVITNLDDIIHGQKDKITDIGFNNLEEEKLLWYDANKELIQQSNSMVIMGKLTSDLKRLNKQFTVKNSQYKFDDEILNPLVVSHIKKIEDSLRADTYGVNLDKDINADGDTGSNEMNDMVESLLAEHGELGLKDILICTFDGMGASEIREALNLIKRPNREKCASLIGFKL